MLHLVDGAVTDSGQVVFHKVASDIINAFRFLEGNEILVIALLWEEIVHDWEDWENWE